MFRALPLIAVSVASYAGSWLYRRLALQRGIVAKLNSRTLHETVVPRGGGIAFTAVFAVAVIIGWLMGDVSTDGMLCFGLGGAAAGMAGFIDDVYDVPAAKKLIIQVCLSAWIFATLIGALYAPLARELDAVWAVVLAALFLFVPVWLINLYNFIDGIDGLAVSGALFICIAAIIVLGLTGGDRAFILIFALIAVACLGFLPMNMPPASMFMGDAGSIFLGYCSSALVLATVLTGQMSVWTWLCILGYFVADTTTTTALRFFMVKRWYGVHRSHAYQNLARIYKSHAKVTYGVMLYDVVWALPLAVWSARHPRSAYVDAILVLVPAVLWTLRFGPRLSSD